MTRRDFLHLTATTGAAATLASRHSAAPVGPSPSSIPAIDTHIHLYDPTRAEGVPWPPKTDPLLYRPYLPDTYQAVTAELKVVGAIVVEASSWPEDNQWILDLAAKHSGIVGLVGNLAPGRAEFAPALQRFAANPLFRGLRLRAADLQKIGDPAFDADLRRVADADLSIDVLGGVATIEATRKLAQLAPTLRVVVNHLPFKEWDGKPDALRTALAPLASLRQVFIKGSDVMRRSGPTVIEDPAFYAPGLDALVELFGPDRIVFGSNWPVSERVAPYATLHRVLTAYFNRHSRTLAENYFWRNSYRAYRWQARGAAATLLE